VKWKEMCRRKGILINKKRFPKSKERSGCKNKDFLTISCTFNEQKNLVGEKKKRESEDSSVSIRGIILLLLYTLFWPYRTMYHNSRNFHCLCFGSSRIL